MAGQLISADYYRVLESAEKSLDIKVTSPWPGQIARRAELRHLMEPEHILVRHAKAGIPCRSICLEPESYRRFFTTGGDPMAEKPYCDEVQNMLGDFQDVGGKVRFIKEATNPEISFVVADKVRAIMFLGVWLACGEEHFRQTAFLSEDRETIKFLLDAFELCWTAQ